MIQSDNGHSTEVSITTSFEPTNTVPGAAAMPNSCRRISARIGIEPPWNPITSRFRPIPTATAAVPAILRLYAHQMPITAIATKNIPGIRIPARLPICGTIATASSGQKRGRRGRRQNANAPLTSAPMIDSISIAIEGYQLTLETITPVPGGVQPAVPAKSSVPATRAAISARTMRVFIFQLLGLRRSTITRATIVHAVDKPWTFRGHALTLF